MNEKEIRNMVAPNVLNMLETLNIDPLGVSTDSLMLIVPPDIVSDVKKAVGTDGLDLSRTIVQKMFESKKQKSS